MSNNGKDHSLNGHRPDPATLVTTDDGQLVSVESVAKMLAVSPRTLWRWNSAGKVPAPVKVGGTTRWRLADVLRWINGGCQ